MKRAKREVSIPRRYLDDDASVPPSVVKKAVSALRQTKTTTTKKTNSSQGSSAATKPLKKKKKNVEKKEKAVGSTSDNNGKINTKARPTQSKAVTNSKSTKPKFIKAEPPFALLQSSTMPDVMDSVANLLRGRKNIMVLAGAGISVSCGIPDFRSKGSGLYSTLDHEGLGLSNPEELFDWEVFQHDPRPFFKFARKLYFPLGDSQRVRPSDSHKLLALLEQKKMLLRVYTQNIDGLEQLAGVSPKHMVYAHGSLQFATCTKCRRKVTAADIEPSILNGTVPLCQHLLPEQASSTNNGTTASQRIGLAQPARSKKRPRPVLGGFNPVQEEGKPRTCNGVLKPGVTFFGEALHDTVSKSLESDREKVDALIVMGTSLSVAPMSKVISYLPANIPRILINRNIVHPKTSTGIKRAASNGSEDEDQQNVEFREKYMFDAYLLGFCDDVTRVLAKKMFGSEANEDQDNQTHYQALASLRERQTRKSGEEPKTEDDEDSDNDDAEPEAFQADAWEFCKLPEERVVLFPGAAPTKGNGYGDDGHEDEASAVSFHEVAHCDGCSKRIAGTIHKCVDCFDYDLCKRCYPKLSKSHFNGEHAFSDEPTAA